MDTSATLLMLSHQTIGTPRRVTCSSLNKDSNHIVFTDTQAKACYSALWVLDIETISCFCDDQ